MEKMKGLRTSALLAAALCGAAASAGPAPVPKNVPELMTAFDGRKIETVAQWEKIRAPELLREFTEVEYGRRPVERPPKLSFARTQPDCDAMDGKAVRMMVRITYGGKFGEKSFDALAFVPKQEKPAPAFLLICNRFPGDRLDPERVKKDPFWPAEEIVARGYAAVAFYNCDVTPDGDYGNRVGVFSCFEDPEPHDRNIRRNDLWGTLSAWAWGASRVLDWMETEPRIDAKRVAVVGHSRGGKTALVAAVYDKRFAMACSNDSGCCGAKLNHIDLPRSEHLHQIVRTFPYWFCKSFAGKVNAEKSWRVDQHEFIALIAPRLVCIASASEDAWAGQPGEWWSGKLASPAWALYGKKGLVADAWPAPEVPQQEGCISYHIRKGKHDLALYDWNRYMDFADRHGWRD